MFYRSLPDTVEIGGVEICRELLTMVVAQQIQINNNLYKDDPYCRGWKMVTPAMGMIQLGEEVMDLRRAISRIEEPPEGDVRNCPSSDELLKECADIANQAMHVADQLGVLE